jgi:hypothetical protein
MKINQLFEGYYSRLDLERQEDERLGIKRRPPQIPSKPANENQRYHIALWYDTSGYLVTTVAPTLKKAQSIALYRVKQYLKANYPRYDVTGLRKDQVHMEQIPDEQVREKSRKLIVV